MTKSPFSSSCELRSRLATSTFDRFAAKLVYEFKLLFFALVPIREITERVLSTTTNHCRDSGSESQDATRSRPRRGTGGVRRLRAR